MFRVGLWNVGSARSEAFPDSSDRLDRPTGRFGLRFRAQSAEQRPAREKGTHTGDDLFRLITRSPS